MSDPKIALASIGIVHRTRAGPPPAIKAIQNDLIKVDFVPFKAAAKLVRLVPKAMAKSSQVVLTPTTPTMDIKGIEEETRLEMNRLNNPIRNLLRTRSTPSVPSSPKRTQNSSLTASTKSSLLISTSRKSSLDLGIKLSFSGGASVSSIALRKQESLPHGFRYHSNGDERVSRSLSCSSSNISSASVQANKAATSFSELTKLRAHIVRSLPRRHKTKLGMHFFGPELEEKLESAAEYHAPSRISSEPAAGTRGDQRTNVHRAVSTSGNDTMFRRTILRHIHDMAQSGESVSHVSLARVTSAPSTTREVDSRAPPKHTKSSVSHGTKPTMESPGDCISAANSSFNMRYGVPVKLMAQRKHILDEQHFKELEEVSKNDALIDTFLMDIKKVNLTGQA